MEIVKSIRISENNISEVFSCPVVYRISKLELDPGIVGKVGSLSIEKDKPTLFVYLSGHELPLSTNHYLIEDEHGLWRGVKTEEYLKLLHKTDG